MSHSAWILPIVFLCGALAGGLLAWHWRGRRAAVGPAGPPRSWPLVLSTALLTTLGLAAAGYGLVRHRFQRTQVSRASKEQALADFRRGRSAASPASLGKTPPGGVYTYRATGYYEAEVPVLGKERRDMPKTVPAILVPSGDCWELTHRYFEQHHWTGRFCRDPEGGLRLDWARNKNEMFSMKTESRSICEPRALVLPGKRPGEPWTLTCTSDPPRPERSPGNVEMLGSLVGEETVEVDGRPQPARRVRRAFTMKGPHSGSMVQDLWIAAESGMLLQLTVKGDGKGMAKFVSDYRLTLQSLTPSR